MAKQPKASKFLKQLSPRRIAPPAIDAKLSVADMVDQVFSSYNAGRLREICQVLTQKMLTDDCTVGLTFRALLHQPGLAFRA